MKNVSIIIPNWNGRDLLEKNFPAVLRAMDNKKNYISEVVVVDDKSTDNSLLYLKKNFAGRIKVIAHKTNRGFAASINTGARTAKSDLLCLLNSDVAPSEDFLEKCLGDFNEEIVFGVSLHEKGYGYAIGKFADGFIGHKGGQERETVHETFWASGGSAVFRRDMWMELGGLDEKLFSPFYWEDIDISYRAQKRGYRILWDPRLNVVHQHESTVSKLNRGYVSLIQERNQLLFVWKNITSPNLFKKHRVGLLKRVRQHPGYLRIVLMALMKFWIVRRLRAKEKKEAVVSDEAIFARFNK